MGREGEEEEEEEPLPPPPPTSHHNNYQPLKDSITAVIPSALTYDNADINKSTKLGLFTDHVKVAHSAVLEQKRVFRQRAKINVKTQKRADLTHGFMP